MSRFTPAPQPADRSLLQAAVLVSLALHVFLLFLQNPFPSFSARPDWTPLALEVVLAPEFSPAETPDSPKAFSEHDSHAGKIVATGKTAAVPTAQTENRHIPAAANVKAATPEKHEVSKQANSDYRLPEQDGSPAPQQANSSTDLLAQARQLASEQNRSEADPRAKGIYGVSATGVSWARYVEDWRLKVERVGKLNYPVEASSRNLFGTLELAVVIRADGSLQEIRMLRSSGHSILDDAARKIVETAAPFAPFPPTLAAEHRSLEIVRRWRFTNQNQLSTH